MAPLAFPHSLSYNVLTGGPAPSIEERGELFMLSENLQKLLQVLTELKDVSVLSETNKFLLSKYVFNLTMPKIQ